MSLQSCHKTIPFRLFIVLFSVCQWQNRCTTHARPSVHLPSHRVLTTIHSTSCDYSTFDDFVSFLLSTQEKIIHQLENIDGSGQVFSRDTWGGLGSGSRNSTHQSGGITRLLFCYKEKWMNRYSAYLSNWSPILYHRWVLENSRQTLAGKLV
jgi:hypothetical protein